MSEKLDIEYAATRAPQVAGNRYVRQARHRARGHQSTTSCGQQICHTRLTKSTRPPEHHKRRATDMSDKLDIEHAATRAPQVEGNRYVRQA
ncbi:hypothetical protein RRG08_059865 [Elysia crispata]|uniref:Uncharacterized protein n=1 Tax=Elysia crispata TaxID=231223 RepID=A0AAE1B2M6_9GAST|nr:hypothetical protein RRG08_059865 [Elysia crispata]